MSKLGDGEHGDEIVHISCPRQPDNLRRLRRPRPRLEAIVSVVKDGGRVGVRTKRRRGRGSPDAVTDQLVDCTHLLSRGQGCHVNWVGEAKEASSSGWEGVIFGMMQASHSLHPGGENEDETWCSCGRMPMTPRIRLFRLGLWSMDHGPGIIGRHERGRRIQSSHHYWPHLGRRHAMSAAEHAVF